MIRSEVFLAVAGAKFVKFGFSLHWRYIAGCLLDLYSYGVKQESDCLCHVVTRSGADSNWKFAKQEWVHTKNIRVRTLLFFFTGWTVLSIQC